MSGPETIVALVLWGVEHGNTLLLVAHALFGALAVIVITLSVLTGGAKLIAAVWVWKQALTYLKQRGSKG